MEGFVNLVKHILRLITFLVRVPSTFPRQQVLLKTNTTSVYTTL